MRTTRDEAGRRGPFGPNDGIAFYSSGSPGHMMGSIHDRSVDRRCRPMANRFPGGVFSRRPDQNRRTLLIPWRFLAVICEAKELPFGTASPATVSSPEPGPISGICRPLSTIPLSADPLGAGQTSGVGNPRAPKQVLVNWLNPISFCRSPCNVDRSPLVGQDLLPCRQLNLRGRARESGQV